MKIYTRTGDKGKTTLVGGTPVLKTHARIEAYGSVDEVIAHISLLRDMTGNNDLKSYLLWIEERLMTCTAILAADCEDCPIKIPELRNADVKSLENAIDEMELTLEPLNSFILPGGNNISSQCHICTNSLPQGRKRNNKIICRTFCSGYRNKIHEPVVGLSFCALA